MISIHNLDFRYARDGFRLQVPALTVGNGEHVAIVGASGSGKTTLLDLIAGIRRPASGDIIVAGTPMHELGDAARRDFRSRRIGLIFQAFELLEYLSVRDNVLLPFRLGPRLTMPGDAGGLAEQLAGEMDIAGHLDRYPKQLSQGERQRAAICRALVTAPDLILADEPTGNLDPTNKQRVLQILLDQVASHGSTLVMVTHDHDLLAPFDRILDMRDFHESGQS